MNFALPTRDALLEHRRRQIEDGFTFPLAGTSLGMDEMVHARVHRLNTRDRAVMEALPNDIQTVVWEGMKTVRKEQKRIAAQGNAEPESLIEAIKNDEGTMAAANAFCVAGFIEPRLVQTEAELARNPGAYLVTDIAEEDRLGFFIACSDADSDQAGLLKLFRPKPAHDVPGGQTGGLVESPSEPPAGAAFLGV